MTSQPPSRFENYPPASGPESPFPAPEPEPTSFEITAYRPPDVPPPSSSEGTSRRAVVSLLVAVPIGGLILATITKGFNSSRDGSAGEWPSDWATPAGDGSGSGGTGNSDTLEVGQYSAQLPEGWSIESGTGDQVVASRGANRLLADTFTVDPDADRAIDLIGALVKHRQGAFTGSLPSPTDFSSGDVQRAGLTAAGKVRGKPATLKAQLWIDAVGDALLVIETLVAKPGTKVAAEADGMVAELSEGF